MAPLTHTYGPTCHLGPSVALTGSKGDDEMPPMKAQYFYASSQPIDDPLSVVPIPSGADAKSASHPPRPFSPYDNNALEEAWRMIAAGKDKQSTGKRSKTQPATQSVASTRAQMTNESTASLKSVSKSLKKNSFLPELPTARMDIAVAVPVLNSKGHKHDKEAKVARKAAEKDKKSKVSTKDSTKPSASVVIAPTVTAQKDSAKAKKTKKSSGESKKPSEEPSGQPSSDPTNEFHPSPAECDELSGTPNESVVPKECLTDNVGCSELSESQEPSKVQKEGSADSIVCSELSHPQDPTVADKESADSITCPEVNVAQDSSGDATSVSCSELNKDADPEKDRTTSVQSDELIDPNAPAADDGKSTVGEDMSKSSKKESKKEKGSKLASKKSKVLIGEAQGDGTDERDDSDLISNLDGQGSKGDDTTKAKSGPAVKYDFESQLEAITQSAAPAGDAGTTGQPFLKMSFLRSTGPSAADEHDADTMVDGEPLSTPKSKKLDQRESADAETVDVSGCKAQKVKTPETEIPVGVSRLHMVTMPTLQMKPIYWSPIHDIAAVIRGTWFYKDTMYPVEPAVANQLEVGYKELRPWSQTWSDELSSALEVGAAGEEKIAHRLWPKEPEQSLSKTRKTTDHPIIYADPNCAAKCFAGEAAAEGTLDLDETEKKPTDIKTFTKKYANAQVMYKDAQNAFILKPALQPSTYYGRKPMSKIRKGATVGVHVVRGFDWKAWLKLHPSKTAPSSTKTEQSAAVAGDADVTKGPTCAACKAQEERPKVTDLILVIHGIGQKLSERMESFNFTHAINGFRRSVNAELANDAVQKTLRDELGGVMVLPVNWRSSLSFEDSQPTREDKELEPTDFTLKDITPESIPAVRNIISDVMLDIPFYMSHHKPKMIQAAIMEANRVYQLWCKNNPDFPKDGRVHIIAHSLGCAMAFEILSKQPTTVPKSGSVSKKINIKFFDFDTSNLFLSGSPAGFFLLLEKGKLMPRKAQGKAGADGQDDTDPKIVGEAGTYGCLAVDNVYNIMHVNDPIAYRLNATVDPQYAASLKFAQVPSATVGFLESLSNAMRAITPGVAGPPDLAIGQVPRPGVVPRLPSQLEMEVHDFTREELAEKKFYLMNDCGQVDWFLSSGGGPLEIQYLNMLSAHSSYWLSPDFVRFIVLEVGRKPGRNFTLPNTRAIKYGRKDLSRKA